MEKPPLFKGPNFMLFEGARNGDVCEATKRAIECMDFVDVVFEKAKEYEEFPQSKRVLYEENDTARYTWKR